MHCSSIIGCTAYGELHGNWSTFIFIARKPQDTPKLLSKVHNDLKELSLRKGVQMKVISYVIQKLIEKEKEKFYID